MRFVIFSIRFTEFYKPENIIYAVPNHSLPNTMPRRKKALQKKKTTTTKKDDDWSICIVEVGQRYNGEPYVAFKLDDEEKKKAEPASVEELTEWTRLMRLNPETRRQVEFEKRFEAHLRKKNPEFDKRIEEAREKEGLRKIMHEWDRKKFERVQNQTGYRPPESLGDGTYVQKPSRMKFMVVVFPEDPFCATKCGEPRCPQMATHRAIVVADIAKNREKVENGSHPEQWIQPPGYPCAEDLRRSPDTLRSQILYLCPRHRHNSEIRNCFTRFRNDKELKRVVESPVTFTG